MKKQILLLAAIIITGSFSANAQGGGQRMSIEERMKTVMEKLNTGLKLTAEQQTLTDSVFTNYYRSMQKLRQGLPQGERPSQEQMQKLVAERDEKLKTIFKEEQFKKFKDEIETTLRPQRPGGN